VSVRERWREEGREGERPGVLADRQRPAAGREGIGHVEDVEPARIHGGEADLELYNVLYAIHTLIINTRWRCWAGPGPRRRSRSRRFIHNIYADYKYTLEM
jgi:hypothetical protein